MSVVEERTSIEDRRSNIRFSQRRFLLPLLVIIVGAIFVPFGFLEGSIWAATSTTITSGYFALIGYGERKTGPLE